MGLVTNIEVIIIEKDYEGDIRQPSVLQMNEKFLGFGL
jgi:hypothetical protein